MGDGLLKYSWQAPNFFVDDGILALLTGAEAKCYIALQRKILGWKGRRETRRDTISYAQLAKLTGLSRASVIRSMRMLARANLVQMVSIDRARGICWELNLGQLGAFRLEALQAPRDGGSPMAAQEAWALEGADGFRGEDRHGAGADGFDSPPHGSGWMGPQGSGSAGMISSSSSESSGSSSFWPGSSSPEAAEAGPRPSVASDRAPVGSRDPWNDVPLSPKVVPSRLEGDSPQTGPFPSPGRPMNPPSGTSPCGVEIRPEGLGNRGKSPPKDPTCPKPSPVQPSNGIKTTPEKLNTSPGGIKTTPHWSQNAPSSGIKSIPTKPNLNQPINQISPSLEQTFQSEGRGGSGDPACAACHGFGWLYAADAQGEALWEKRTSGRMVPILPCPRCRDGKPRAIRGMDNRPSGHHPAAACLPSHLEGLRPFLEAGHGLLLCMSEQPAYLTEALTLAADWAEAHGRQALYSHAPAFLDHLRACFDRSSHIPFLQRWEASLRIPLLCLDQLHQVRETPWAIERLSTLIQARLQRASSHLTILGCLSSASLHPALHIALQDPHIQRLHLPPPQPP